MTKEDWGNMDEEKFNTIFEKSAVKRAKYSGLRRNIDFLSEPK
jgi:epoxyqueuosine reductase